MRMMMMTMVLKMIMVIMMLIEKVDMGKENVMGWKLIGLCKGPPFC